MELGMPDGSGEELENGSILGVGAGPATGGGDKHSIELGAAEADRRNLGDGK